MAKAKKRNRASAFVSPLTGRDYFVAVMLFILIGIVPIIVRYALVPNTMSEMHIVASGPTTIDIFAFYKSRWVVIGAVALLVFYFYQLYHYGTVDIASEYKQLFKKPLHIAFGVFILGVVLSTLFSPYRDVALRGASTRYEGVFVLLSYIVIFYATLNFAKDVARAKVVLYCVLFSAAIIGLIGFFQTFGMNFFMTDFGIRWVYARHYVPGAGFASLFTAVYSTLFNPNSMGQYGAMVFPLLFITAVFYPQKSFFKYFLFFVSVLVAVSFVGSGSAGGFYGLILGAGLSFVVGIFYLYKFRDTIARQTVVIIAALVVTCFVVLPAGALAIPATRNYLQDMLGKLMNPDHTRDTHLIHDVNASGNNAYIYHRYGIIRISLDEDEGILNLYHNDVFKEPVSSQPLDDGAVVYNFKLDVLGHAELMILPTGIFTIQFHGIFFAFARMENNMFAAVSQRGLPVYLNQEIPSIGFEGREFFASGRGYIWSRSLPMVADSLILGTGPDTFLLRFPQHDIRGKTRFLGMPYILVDKPHNFYLQTAINTGVPSLLALIFIFALYTLSSIQSILKRPMDDAFVFGLQLGILTGVCGYLAAAMSTDSLNSVAPVFWAVLGLGFAINKAREGAYAKV